MVFTCSSSCCPVQLPGQSWDTDQAIPLQFSASGHPPEASWRLMTTSTSSQEEDEDMQTVQWVVFAFLVFVCYVYSTDQSSGDFSLLYVTKSFDHF